MVGPIVVNDMKMSPSVVDKYTARLDAAVNTAGFPTVPSESVRRETSALKKESYKNCYDTSCQIEVGKALAAQKLVFTTWTKFTDGCRLAVELIDLMTEVKKTRSFKASCDLAGLGSAIDLAGQWFVSMKQGGVGTFQLDLEEGRQIKNPPTAETAFLKIDASAGKSGTQSIDVYANGERKRSCASGRLCALSLPLGKYILVLRVPGDRFEHRRFEFELGEEGARIPKEGTIVLRPLVGTLVIRGEPSSATAIIDGSPIRLDGPTRIERRSGTYTVRVEASGYLAAVPKTVRIEPGGQQELVYGLTRDAGALVVDGTPVGAAISLDEQKVGRVPLRLDPVGTGQHLLEIERPGFAPFRKLIEIERGATTSVDVALTEKQGRLVVLGEAKLRDDSELVEAGVYINGERVGTSPWQGLVRAEVEHIVVLRLGNATTRPRAVRVKTGEEAQVAIPVPTIWLLRAGQVSFNLVPGPWTARVGEQTLDTKANNAVAPGRALITLFLDERPVGRTDLVVGPGERYEVAVTARPATEAELSGARTSWNIRRFVALGLTLAAAGIGAQRISAAHDAADQRDAALFAFHNANDRLQQEDLRQEVVAAENDRASAQNVGLALVGTAAGLAAWTLVEWLFLEPDPGKIEGPGVRPWTGEATP